LTSERRGVNIDKLVVVGVGLIGGSFALALRKAHAVRRVVGVGRSAQNLERARERGIVDHAVTLDGDWAMEARDADVVLLAAPVAQFAGLLRALAPQLGGRTIVTDAGSTKQDVAAAARAALGSAFPRFVPAHPIAGSERSGADAADAALFHERRVIVTPLRETDPQAVALVTALWQAAGARVGELAPGRHDRLLAAVSHVPHLLAFAFVDEIAAREDATALFEHAGSGLRDFTRIAASSPEMWRDIALANRPALLAELDLYRGALDAVVRALEEGDGAALEAMFARAAQARRAWTARASYPRGSGGDDA
jgi:prephenate dehydrogenase